MQWWLDIAPSSMYVDGMTLNRLGKAIVVGAFVGASMLGSASNAMATPSHSDDQYAWEVGDDNADGVITEDESGWDCVSMGNRICGPGNDQGKPAACYDDGGVIVALWPCYVVVDQNGDADVYTPDQRDYTN